MAGRRPAESGSGSFARLGSGTQKTQEDTTLAHTVKYNDNRVICGDVGGGRNQGTGRPGPTQLENLLPLPTKHQPGASLSGSLRSDSFPLICLLQLGRGKERVRVESSLLEIQETS